MLHKSLNAFRQIGHGNKIAVIQFVKGAWNSGEKAVLEKFPELVTIKAMGEGFTWETQDRQKDIENAEAAWAEAKKAILDPEIRFVLMDELNIVLRYDYLPIDEVTSFLQNEKPEDTHVVITGRNAKDELIEIADLVTDMTLIKHPFRSGVKAQEGIEF
ncbi:MAG TPA: cob(I)yrinic acid a,c-diamide adenosyltransferase [Rhizobiales bacterium]|nr:cob(I)yrinic acid a,c-diamide adenosyltransferase [Hyphomicrobiales bacterium]